jgi:hypothetical protein
LDLELPRILGRAPINNISVEIIGEVEESDLAILATEGRPMGHYNTLTQLKDRHHSVARLLAAGHRPWEVCAITGYSSAHLSLLQNDPSFNELLAHYRGNEDAATADVASRVRDAAATAVTKLTERLESDEAIDFADLNKATKDLLDRAGHGPRSTKDVNINIGLADRIEAARLRAIAAKKANDDDGLILDMKANA